MNRPAKVTLIIGTNSTGKTTLLKNILKIANQKSLVITPDDYEWLECEETNLLTPSDFVYNGVRRHIFNPDKKTGTLKRLSFFKKGIVVFDDARSYIDSHTLREIRELLIRRRQRELDIFVVGHGFSEIPPVFFTFSTDIILFRTTDNIQLRKNVLKNYEKMKELQEKVNKKSLADPFFKKAIKFI